MLDLRNLPRRELLKGIPGEPVCVFYNDEIDVWICERSSIRWPETTYFRVTMISFDGAKENYCVLESEDITSRSIGDVVETLLRDVSEKCYRAYGLVVRRALCAHFGVKTGTPPTGATPFAVDAFLVGGPRDGVHLHVGWNQTEISFQLMDDPGPHPSRS